MVWLKKILVIEIDHEIQWRNFGSPEWQNVYLKVSKFQIGKWTCRESNHCQVLILPESVNRSESPSE